jgi:hypothetical protein
VTDASAFAPLLEALALPAQARVGTRVPKKLLAEQGAPTAADKRAIQDGIDELHWLAVLKPTTVAIPTFVDETHNYSEIAVLAATLRPQARAGRLSELIHRAIPYPVLLMTLSGPSLSLSVAPKRAAQNEGGKVVVERIVAVDQLAVNAPGEIEAAFLESLAVPRLPAQHLRAVYEGWLARIEALAAARLCGHYDAGNDEALTERRRMALAEHTRLSREVAQLRAQAARAKQISQRVALNQQIKALEAAMNENKKGLRGGSV